MNERKKESRPSFLSLSNHALTPSKDQPRIVNPRKATMKKLKARPEKVKEKKIPTYDMEAKTTERNAVYEPENFGVHLGYNSRNIREFMRQTPFTSDAIVGSNWIQMMCLLAKGRSYTSQGTTNLFGITLAGTGQGKSNTQNRVIIRQEENDFSSGKNVLAHLKEEPLLTLKMDEASSFYEKISSQNNRGISHKLLTLNDSILGHEEKIARNQEEMSQDKTTVISPAFSIIGSSTLAGMKRAFSQHAIESGETNRIVFFMGDFDGKERQHYQEDCPLIDPELEAWNTNSDIEYTKFTAEAQAFTDYIRADSSDVAIELGIPELSTRWLSHARKIAQAVAFLDGTSVTPNLLNWAYSIVKMQGISFYAQMITRTSDQIDLPDWVSPQDFRKSTFPKHIKGSSLLETKRLINEFIRSEVLIAEILIGEEWGPAIEVDSSTRTKNAYRVKSNPEAKIEAVDLKVKFLEIPDFTPNEIREAQDQLRKDKDRFEHQFNKHIKLKTQEGQL